MLPVARLLEQHRFLRSISVRTPLFFGCISHEVDILCWCPNKKMLGVSFLICFFIIIISILLFEYTHSNEISRIMRIGVDVLPQKYTFAGYCTYDFCLWKLESHRYLYKKYNKNIPYTWIISTPSFAQMCDA